MFPRISVTDQFALGPVFSVQPLWSLCLGGEFPVRKTHHIDTENTEDAQR
jgi:hypothetical protein